MIVDKETNFTKNLKKVTGVTVVESEDLPAKKHIPLADTVKFTYGNATLNSMAFESDLMSIAALNYGFRFTISSKINKDKWNEIIEQFNKTQIAVKCIKNDGDNRVIFSCEFIYEKNQDLEKIIHRYLSVLLNSATRMSFILDKHNIKYVKISSKDN
jgi:predicted regulator of Ras-like GTPase activity (Roadblock/LC7/MglB family)